LFEFKPIPNYINMFLNRFGNMFYKSYTII